MAKQWLSTDPWGTPDITWAICDDSLQWYIVSGLTSYPTPILEDKGWCLKLRVYPLVDCGIPYHFKVTG